jgi:hypothetical protein
VQISAGALTYLQLVRDKGGRLPALRAVRAWASAHMLGLYKTEVKA